MACASSKDFASCVSYALSCLKKEDLVLKPEQSAALEFVFKGKDVFIWFPTGFGKSICYQALPFMFDHKLGRNNMPSPMADRSVVLVVSPLISLMVDQVTSLRSVGVGAAILGSSHGGDGQLTKELLVNERDIEKGNFSVLFGTPEAIIGSERWRELFLGDPLHQQIVAVAVDEAHCVYKWYLGYLSVIIFPCLNVYSFQSTCIYIQESKI